MNPKLLAAVAALLTAWKSVQEALELPEPKNKKKEAVEIVEDDDDDDDDDDDVETPTQKKKRLAAEKKKAADKKKKAAAEDDDDDDDDTPVTVVDGTKKKKKTVEEDDDDDDDDEDNGLTLKDLREQARPIIKAGHTEEVKTLLEKYDADSLTTLEEEHFEKFSAALTKLGKKLGVK